MLEFGGLFQLNPTGFVLAVSADDIETFRDTYASNWVERWRDAYCVLSSKLFQKGGVHAICAFLTEDSGSERMVAIHVLKKN